jgi:arsenate reductase
MNIQIYGTSKSFDTKKAERWFKERRISYQMVDLVKYGLAGREFDSVLRAVGGIDNLVDWNSKSPDIDLLKYLSDPVQKEDKVYENQKLIRQPVVRNGKQATVGYCPEIWETWK